MTTTTHDETLPAGGLPSRRRMRPGDFVFQGIAFLAAAGSAVVLGLLAYKVIAQAWPAIRHFGIAFVWHYVWNPNSAAFGAASFVFGTILTSFIALLLATPISIAIALFLTEIAPKRLATPIATVVELLAAIPSVVLGLWGILVLGPFMNNHAEPWLKGVLGWLPIFSGPTSQAGVLVAAVILTIMIVPIVTALCRELLSRVPRDLTDGSLALGSTKWEAIRRVALPYAAPGISAAMLLGLGRALGEAIAVTQVIGSQTWIGVSLFHPGDTLASKIAATYQGADTQLQLDSLLYLGAILMVITLVTNFVAQTIVTRFEKARRLA